MDSKPRKPRRSTEEIVDELVRERVNEAMANPTLDGGTYLTAEEIAAATSAAPQVQEPQVQEPQVQEPQVQEPPKRKRGPGRPPEHNWARIDAVLDWYLSDRSVQRLLPQGDFAGSVRNWCRLDNPGKKPPHVKQVEKRLQRRSK
jgi:hypothetical protein